MANNSDKRDLGYLGDEFQKRLIHALMENEDFFRDIIDIVDQNMFTNITLRQYVMLIKNFYQTQGIKPSYVVMEMYINEKIRSEIDKESVKEFNKEVQNVSFEAIDYIKTVATRFFKQQNIVRVANEILKIAGNGDSEKYDECVDLINQAVNVGIKDDFGSSVFDNIEDTLSAEYRIPIPTGLGVLDEALEGGIGKGELGMIIAPSGVGKAQPLNARILTPNGYKLMGDISVGDEVIGYDGNAHKVIGVFPQGKRPVYRVDFSNGHSCECDEEHLWNVNTYYQRTHKKYIGQVLQDGKKVTKRRTEPDYSFKTWSLKDIIKRGIHKKKGDGHIVNVFRIPKNNAVNFAKKDVPVDPYLLGYYIGDGCFQKGTITVGQSDYEHAINIFKPMLLEDIHPIYHEDRNIYDFYLRGKTRAFLKKYLGIGTSKSKIIPNEYIFNDIETRLSLLQGLLDSDGSVLKRGDCEFSSKSEELAKQVRWLIESLGGYATIKSKKTFYTKNGIRKDTGITYRVHFTMVDPRYNPFRMPRKAELIKFRDKYKEDIYIENVTYLREDYTKCILIDSDDHLYLTEDFIVTHNTSLTTSLASNAALSGYKVLQIVFEDRVKQIQRKHIGKLTGIESKDLSKEEYIEHVKEILSNYTDKEKLKANLKIVRFPTGEITASYLEHYINKLTNKGFKPDLVIIDYFECLLHTSDEKGATEWEKEGKTMRKLEALAGKTNIAFWIPTQGSRDSIGAELVTMSQSGGSVKKGQIAHIVLSIAKSTDDAANNKATIALLKNRSGGSGKIWNNLDFNNGTCIISDENVTTANNTIEFENRKEADLKQTASALLRKAKADKLTQGVVKGMF